MSITRRASPAGDAVSPPTTVKSLHQTPEDPAGEEPAAGAAPVSQREDPGAPGAPESDAQAYLRRLVCALHMAAPLVLARQFSDGLSHSFDVSVAACRVLCDHGVSARLLPTVLYVLSERRGVGLVVGVTAGEHAQFLRENADALLAAPTAEGAAEEGGREGVDVVHTHLVAEGRFGGERVVVDLTLGQLREHGVPAPACLSWFGEEWAEREWGGWRVEFGPSPREEWLLALFADSLDPAQADPETECVYRDLARLVALALSLDLDRDRLGAALTQEDPARYAMALHRIARFAELGEPPGRSDESPGEAAGGEAGSSDAPGSTRGAPQKLLN